MFRGTLSVAALILLGAVVACTAQESAEIVVGAKTVCEIRARGQYGSVELRRAAIEEAIQQVLASGSGEAALAVTVDKVDEVWTVLVDGQRIMSVYPEDATAYGTTPGTLAAMWAAGLEEALPGAAYATVQELPATGEQPATGAEPATGAAPMTISVTSPTTEGPVTSAGPLTSEGPATGSTTAVSTGPLEVVEEPGAEEQPETVVVGEGARLLILEAFNNARELPEDDYLVQREALANELFDNLVQVITEGEAIGRIETGAAAQPPTRPEPPPIETAATEPGEEATADTATAPPPVTVSAETGETGELTDALAMSDEAREKILEKIPEDAPGYENVVAKIAVKAKFRAATGAYREAVDGDPAVAAQAKEVLSAAREANTAGEFATAERYLDTALRLLGVTQWEQFIDPAMSDLGLID